MVQEAGGGDRSDRSRRLVYRKALDDRGRFDRLHVVPTRFVRACPRGHVDDLDWAGFVNGPEDRCRRQLWLDEVGTTGDLADLVVRCECGRSRRLYEAAELDQNPLGTCRGACPTPRGGSPAASAPASRRWFSSTGCARCSPSSDSPASKR